MVFCAQKTYFNSWDLVALITLPHRQKFATSVSGCDFDYLPPLPLPSPPTTTTMMMLSSSYSYSFVKLNFKFQVNIWIWHASRDVHKLKQIFYIGKVKRKYEIALKCIPRTTNNIRTQIIHNKRMNRNGICEWKQQTKGKYQKNKKK